VGRMRAIATAVAVLTGILVPAGAAAPPKVQPISPIKIVPIGSMTARAVPAQSGARPVALRLTVRTELQCGRPRGGPIVVAFPAAERMPASLQAGDVLVNGKALDATLSGHVVSIALPKTTGVTCDVIGPGTVSVVFTKRANLGSPLAPGTYHVSLRVRGTSAVAPFTIAAAASGLFGTVVISPSTPVCQAGKPCTAPAAGVKLTFSQGGKDVQSVVTSSAGHYRLGLAPGVYSVRPVTRSKIDRLAPTTVTVAPGVAGPRNFTLDTGIR
jgi:hypothetical protein